MDCPRCERRFLDEYDHKKEECDQEQIPLTDDEVLQMAERLFNYEVNQCNYGKKVNDGLRKMHTIIREATLK